MVFNPVLQTEFEAIERQRLALQALAAALPLLQLQWKPDAETWSVQQIIEHLVLSDETLGQASKAEVTEREEMPFRLLPRALRRSLILGAFRRDLTLPLPSPAVEPSGTLALTTLRERWKKARAKMRRDLEAQTGTEKLYSHPVLGPLTAAQMLELARVHTAYHGRQLDARKRDAAQVLDCQ